MKADEVFPYHELFQSFLRAIRAQKQRHRVIDRMIDYSSSDRCYRGPIDCDQEREIRIEIILHQTSLPCPRP